MPKSDPTGAKPDHGLERWKGGSDAPGGFEDAKPFEVSVAGHRIAIFPAGADRLAALLDAIDHAEVSLYGFFYLFQADEAGETVRAALIAAARRGVAVHLIVDAFGSDAPDTFFAPLIEAGARFDRFSARWSVRFLIRNHQKFLIIDGKRVITGGFNISDHYFKPPDENGWCDLGALIEGPLAGTFTKWFTQLEEWASKPDAQFRAIRQLVREWEPDEGPLQLILGGPTFANSRWARRLKRDLANGSRLDLVMAYFSPPRSFRQLIQSLSRRGEARLIMAGKTDNGATIGASRSLYSALIGSGARIAEFQPCKLHMKLLVIDDITYIGSANMDMRSVRLNLELMVRIEDADLAHRMRQLIDHLEAHSEPVTAEWFDQKAGWFNRLRWNTSFWLVYALDYTVTRRLNLGQ